MSGRTGHEAFGVNLETLAKAEEGVHQAVSELDEMGGPFGLGGKDGAGLERGLRSKAPEVGEGPLAAALMGFGSAWEWGMRHLVDDGRGAADALRDTRAWYQKMDDHAVNALKQGLHGAFGNPMEDSEQAAKKSWGELGSDLAPDWSADSFRESADDLKKTIGQ